jgi:hypothetical protein
VGLLLIYRRYLHRERMNARFRSEYELESAWRAKQEAQPGTALPSTFPFLSQLAAGGYTTQQDLHGADSCELQEIADLNPRDAQAVLSALAMLAPLP